MSDTIFIPTFNQAQTVLENYGAPLFLTDAQTIQNRAALISDAFSDPKVDVFYAIKANYNPTIVRTIKEAGIYGIDAVAPHEIRLALQLGYTPEQITFTPSNPTAEEIDFAQRSGVIQNLGSLSELQSFGKQFPGGKVSIRICPEVGAGEFAQIITGEIENKFGISLSKLNEVKKILNEFNLTLVGLHSHIGSGFYDPGKFSTSVQIVCDLARQFESLEFLDFGGGFGVRYKLDQQMIDLPAFGQSIKSTIADFKKDLGRDIQLRIEPGKFLVTESTTLLCKVVTVKEKGHKTFVGLNTGFNHLIRPAMYGAYHHVVNLTGNEERRELKEVCLVGNICESGDIMRESVELPEPKEGDIVAILCAGGYGASMSSNYNMRSRAAEVMVDGDEMILTRRADAYEDIVSSFIF